MRKIIVDCDPGMDDSSAIIMAVKNPNLDIQAVTTVNGLSLIHISEPTRH
mgnify:CR=1 FL=1